MGTKLSSIHPSIQPSLYLSVCQALLARSWRCKHEAELSGEEEKEQLSVAHQPVKSAMFVSSHNHHLHAKTHTHTHARCICFVVDLPPPDCECCGLLQQHRYYGIVTGCDENRHKQWWELNENKDPCMGAKKKGHKHKRFLYLVLAHTSFYAQLLYTVCTVYMPVSSKLLMPVIISPRSVLPCVGSTTANNSNPSQEHNLAPVQYNCILFIFMHLFRGILFYVSMFWDDYLPTLL